MRIRILNCTWAKVSAIQYIPNESLGCRFKSRIRVPNFSRKGYSCKEETFLKITYMLKGKVRDTMSKHKARSDAKISPDKLNFIYKL